MTVYFFCDAKNAQGFVFHRKQNFLQLLALKPLGLAHNFIEIRTKHLFKDSLLQIGLIRGQFCLDAL